MNKLELLQYLSDNLPDGDFVPEFKYINMPLSFDSDLRALSYGQHPENGKIVHFEQPSKIELEIKGEIYERNRRHFS